MISLVDVVEREQFRRGPKITNLIRIILHDEKDAQYVQQQPHLPATETQMEAGEGICVLLCLSHPFSYRPFF